jgi:hypothetical protein
MSLHQRRLALVLSDDGLPHPGSRIVERHQRLPLEGIAAILTFLLPEFPAVSHALAS